MEYMILIYADESRWAEMTPEQGQLMYADYMQYSRELAEAGVMKSGSELKPTSTAKSLRTKNGSVVTTDGPFAETREQLGGYYLVDVPNQESALAWAAKCPGVRTGSVEVRLCANAANAAAAQKA
ncbi:MAG: YciI family protein [Bryobacteraceae bacterium]|nr:YciI family protein [Bryobacteraceae bacterium]